MEDIDIVQYSGDGYKPLIDFENWRVAALKYCEELEIRNLKTMQKHDQTDEVFILLEEHCFLFTGGHEEMIGEINGIAMEPGKLYNIKKGVWHTHTLDKSALVIIVENRNTSDANSPTMKLSGKQIEQLYKTFGL